MIKSCICNYFFASFMSEDDVFMSLVLCECNGLYQPKSTTGWEKPPAWLKFPSGSHDVTLQLTPRKIFLMHFFVIYYLAEKKRIFFEPWVEAAAAAFIYIFQAEPSSIASKSGSSKGTRSSASDIMQRWMTEQSRPLDISWAVRMFYRSATIFLAYFL